MSSPIADALTRIGERIDEAVRRRGPGPDVTLIGVSKKQPLERMQAALQAGLLDFGENYAQELRDKRRSMTDPRMRWHFIGPVQTNKVKYVLGCALIHTVDRTELLEALEARAAREGVHQDVLVQVNVAGEAQKHGVTPEHLPALLDAFASVCNVHCRGLMVIPPIGTPEQTRPHFAALRALRDRLAAQARDNVDLHELSMGMSSDFEVAVEEGATLVRVGTAIFGPRP